MKSKFTLIQKMPSILIQKLILEHIKITFLIEHSKQLQLISGHIHSHKSQNNISFISR